MPQENHFQYSESVQEILGRPPKWIVRYGITIIFIVIIGLFIGSYYIKYPNVIQAPITITTEHLPAGVAARCDGKIDSIFFNEGEQITQGALLAVLENPARWQDVLWLHQHLEAIPQDSILQLGHIQSAYITYLKAKNDYAYFLQTEYHRKKIAVIEKQIAIEKKILHHTEEQCQNQFKQLEIANTLFHIDSSLYTLGATAKLEYENSKSRYLQQQQAYETSKANISSQKISILQLEQTIFDLEQEFTEQENILNLNLKGSRDILLSEIETWEQTYLLKSPCEGKVTFTSYWQKNQNVTNGEIVATIVPEQQTNIIGKIALPQQGAGKVKIGQIVNIKLDNFPYMEYGMLKVVIRKISLVTLQNNEGNRSYILEVSFPNHLETTYKKTLPFSQEMTGTAEIITEDLRLIDRFINPIRSIIYR